MSLVEFLSQPIFQRFGLTLLHFLWQGLAVGVVAAVVVWLFRIKHGNTRYAAYLLAFAAMVVCPVVTFTMIDIPDVSQVDVVKEMPTLKETVMKSYVPLPAVEASSVMEVSRSAPFADETVILPPVTSFSEPLEEVSVPFTERLSAMLDVLMPWVVAVWLAGVVVLSVRLLAGFIGIHRLQKNLLELDDDLAGRVAGLTGRLGMLGFSRVFISPKVCQAMAVGYIKPVVLLPAAFLTQMPVDMVEAVIAHELAHIRRFDLWVNLLQRLVETLLFYHPAVWWLSNKIRSERELCCDAMAVKVTGQRLTYARTLQKVTHDKAKHRKSLLAAGLGKDTKPTLSRVRHILGLKPHKQNSPTWQAGLIAVLLLAAIAIPATVALTNHSVDKQDAKDAVSDQDDSIAELFALDEFEIGMSANEFKEANPNAQPGSSKFSYGDGLPPANSFEPEYFFLKFEGERFWDSSMINIEFGKVSGCIYYRRNDWGTSRRTVPVIYSLLVKHFGTEPKKMVASAEMPVKPTSEKNPVYIWEKGDVVYAFDHSSLDYQKKGTLSAYSLKAMMKARLEEYFVELSDPSEKDEKLFDAIKGYDYSRDEVETSERFVHRTVSFPKQSVFDLDKDTGYANYLKQGLTADVIKSSGFDLYIRMFRGVHLIAANMKIVEITNYELDLSAEEIWSRVNHLTPTVEKHLRGAGVYAFQTDKKRVGILRVSDSISTEPPFFNFSYKIFPLRFREVAEEEELKHSSLPNGQVVLALDDPQAGNVFSFLQGRGRLRKESSEPAMASFRTAYHRGIADVILNDSEDMQFSITSGKVKLLGEGTLGELINKPPDADLESAGQVPVRLGFRYLVKTNKGKYGLFRVLAVAKRAIMIQWIYQPDGSTSFSGSGGLLDKKLYYSGSDVLSFYTGASTPRVTTVLQNLRELGVRACIEYGKDDYNTKIKRLSGDGTSRQGTVRSVLDEFVKKTGRHKWELVKGTNIICIYKSKKSLLDWTPNWKKINTPIKNRSWISIIKEMDLAGHDIQFPHWSGLNVIRGRMIRTPPDKLISIDVDRKDSARTVLAKICREYGDGMYFTLRSTKQGRNELVFETNPSLHELSLLEEIKGSETIIPTDSGLDFDVEQNTSWLTNAQPDGFGLVFTVTNKAGKKVGSGMLDSGLYINGTKVKNWWNILAFRLRKAQRTNDIDAGNSFKLYYWVDQNVFRYDKNKKPIEVEIEWHVSNQVKKTKAVISKSRLLPLGYDKVDEMFKLIRRGEKVDLKLVYQSLIGPQTTLRAEAATYLGEHGDRSSIPYLIDALADESMHFATDSGKAFTRSRVNESLKKLSGKDFGFIWNDPQEKRFEAIEKWQNWWRESEKELSAHADNLWGFGPVRSLTLDLLKESGRSVFIDLDKDAAVRAPADLTGGDLNRLKEWAVENKLPFEFRYNMKGFEIAAHETQMGTSARFPADKQMMAEYPETVDFTGRLKVDEMRFYTIKSKELTQSLHNSAWGEIRFNVGNKQENEKRMRGFRNQKFSLDVAMLPAIIQFRDSRGRDGIMHIQSYDTQTGKLKLRWKTVQGYKAEMNKSESKAAGAKNYTSDAFAAELSNLQRKNASIIGVPALIEAYEELIAKYRKDSCVAGAYLALGHIYESTWDGQDRDKALEYFLLAAKTADVNDTKIWKKANFYTFNRLLGKDYSKAEKMLVDMKKHLKEGDMLFAAELQEKYMDLYSYQGRIDDAEKQYRKMISVYDDPSWKSLESSVKEEIKSLILGASGNMIAYIQNGGVGMTASERLRRLEGLARISIIGQLNRYRDAVKVLRDHAGFESAVDEPEKKSIGSRYGNIYTGRKLDILERAGIYPMGQQVINPDGTYTKPKYGDVELAKFEKLLKSKFKAPFTVERAVGWYKAEKDSETRAALIRLMAASKDESVLSVIGPAINDKDLKVRVSAVYSIMMYFMKGALSGGTEQHFEYVKDFLEKRNAMIAHDIADEKGWSKPQNGLRCKMVPAKSWFGVKEPLKFSFYAQNVSDKFLLLRNSVFSGNQLIPNLRFVLNGGRGNNWGSSSKFSSLSGEYARVSPGETLRCSISIDKLQSLSFSDIDYHVEADTSKPGKYRVSANFGQHGKGYPEGWWIGNVQIPEFEIEVLDKIPALKKELKELNSKSTKQDYNWPTYRPKYAPSDKTFAGFTAEELIPYILGEKRRDDIDDMKGGSRFACSWFVWKTRDNPELREKLADAILLKLFCVKSRHDNHHLAQFLGVLEMTDHIAALFEAAPGNDCCYGPALVESLAQCGTPEYAPMLIKAFDYDSQGCVNPALEKLTGEKVSGELKYLSSNVKKFKELWTIWWEKTYPGKKLAPPSDKYLKLLADERIQATRRIRKVLSAVYKYRERREKENPKKEGPPQLPKKLSELIGIEYYRGEKLTEKDLKGIHYQPPGKDKDFDLYNHPLLIDTSLLKNYNLFAAAYIEGRIDLLKPEQFVLLDLPEKIKSAYYYPRIAEETIKYAWIAGNKKQVDWKLRVVTPEVPPQAYPPKWLLKKGDKAKEGCIPSVSAAMSIVEYIKASDDGKYLAVGSVGEGHRILEVIDLTALLEQKKYKVLQSIGHLTGGVRFDRWDDQKLIFKSGALMTHLDKEGNSLHPSLGIMPTQTYSISIETGEIEPLSEGAKDPVGCYIKQLSSKEDFTRANAAIALDYLNATSAIGELKKVLAIEKDKAVKADIQRAIDQLTYRIVPGVCVGQITAKISENDLRRIYGTGNVKSTDIDVGEGDTEPGTILFANDPQRRLSILWKNANKRAAPRQVIVSALESKWNMKLPNGLTISAGTTLKELQAMNAKPFELSGFGWDYSGTVLSWKEGFLKDFLGEFELNDNRKVMLRLTENDFEKLSQKESRSVAGDKPYSSANPVMQKLNPKVYEVVIFFRQNMSNVSAVEPVPEEYALGKKVDGLQVGITIPKKGFGLDEPIPVKWEIRNVSREDKAIIWHRLHYSPVVFEAGKDGKDKAILKDFRRSIDTRKAGYAQMLVLKPGESKQAEFDLRRFGLYGYVERGVYQISGMYSYSEAISNYSFDKKDLDGCYTGNIASAPLKITLTGSTAWLEDQLKKAEFFDRLTAARRLEPLIGSEKVLQELEKIYPPKDTRQMVWLVDHMAEFGDTSHVSEVVYMYENGGYAPFWKDYGEDVLIFLLKWGKQRGVDLLVKYLDENKEAAKGTHEHYRKQRFLRKLKEGSYWYFDFKVDEEVREKLLKHANNSTDETMASEKLNSDLVAKRDKLLADAQAEIQSGLIKLSKRFPQLKKAPRWQQQTTQAPKGGPIYISMAYPRLMRSKPKPKPSPDNYVVSVAVLPPSSMAGRRGGPWLPLSLYLNLRLAGQVNTRADNPELDAALKKLVDDALKPIKQLEDSLANNKKTKISIIPLRNFAESYQPKPNEGCHVPLLPAPSKEVKYVLENHPIDKEYSQNLTLVFLKLYRYHMENSLQGYELRSDGPLNPFISAFARMARFNDGWNNKVEILHSGIVMSWLDLHPYMGRNLNIANELDRIRKVQKNIKAGIYWNKNEAKHKKSKGTNIASNDLTGIFRLEKDSYLVGEPIFATFEVTNNGQHPYSFNAGANTSAGLLCSVKVRNRQGRDLTYELDGIISQWMVPVTIEPGGKTFREYLMVSSRAPLLPTGDYYVEISRTLSPPVHIGSKVEIDLENNKPVTFTDRLNFKVKPYDYKKLKHALSESGGLIDRKSRDGFKQPVFKPVNSALKDVSRKFEMGFTRGKQVPRQAVIDRLPKKIDDSYFLDVTLKQNRNWLTGSGPEKYELTFRITNNSNKNLDSGILKSKLSIDSIELKGWKEILSKKLFARGAAFIEPGKTLEFTYGFNGYVREIGEHEIKWQINNASRTVKVKVRRDEKIPPDVVYNISNLSMAAKQDYPGITEDQWDMAIKQTVALAKKLKSQGLSRKRPKKLIGVNTLQERLAIYRQFLEAPDRKTLDSIYTVMSYGGPETLPVLIEALDSPKVWVRRVATSLLGDRGQVAVDHLIKALENDPDSGVRSNAAMSLAAIQSPKAAPHLLKALKDKDRLVRLAAIDSLKYFPDEKVFDSLVEMLKVDHKNHYSRIISSLTYIDYQRAKTVVTEIAKTVKDKHIADEMVRHAEGHPGNLYGVWPWELAHVVQLARDADTIAAESYTDEDIQLLIENINHESSIVRSMCTLAITWLGDERAFPAIVESINNAKSVESSYSALISIGTKESVNYYVDQYRLASDLGKQIMVGALSSCPKSAVPMLMVLLNDSGLHRDGRDMKFRHTYWPQYHMAHGVLGSLLGSTKSINVEHPKEPIRPGQLKKEIEQLKSWWQKNSELFLQNQKVPRTPTITNYYGAS